MRTTTIIQALTVILIFTSVSLRSQDVSDPNAIDFEELNYYEMYEQFQAELKANPDAFSESELKHWARFDYLWHSRLQTDDPAKRGDMLTYTATLINYMTQFVCGESEEGKPWEPIGPLEEGENSIDTWIDNMGRVDGIYVKSENPAEILIGMPTSGIWYTQNADEANVDDIVWECVTDNIRYPGIGVTSIERNPFNPNHFVAATGFAAHRGYGPGPLQSFDGGQTWELIESFFYQDGAQLNDYDSFRASTRVNSIKFSPHTDGLMFACTVKKFFVSVNGGMSWEVRNSFEDQFDGVEGLEYNEYLEHIVCAPTSDNILLYLGNFSLVDPGVGRVLRSSNNGIDWVSINEELMAGMNLTGATSWLPNDTEFDSFQSDWVEYNEGPQQFVFINGSWTPLEIAGDNGIQAPITEDPNEETSILVGYSGIPARPYNIEKYGESIDYVLNIRATLPAYSKVDVLFNYRQGGTNHWTLFNEYNELINSSENELEIDIEIPISGDEISVFLEEVDAMNNNQLHGVGLQFLPLVGYVSGAPVWLSKFAFDVDGELGFFWVNFDVSNNKIYLHGQLKHTLKTKISTVVVSDDNGLSWSLESPSETLSDSHKNTLRVSTLNNENKYFAGLTLKKAYPEGGVGVNSSLLHYDIRGIQLLESTDGTQDIVYVATDGGINRSEDSGQTWSCLNGSNLGVTQFYELAVHDRLRNTVVGGAQDGNNFLWQNSAWSPISGLDVHSVAFVDQSRYVRYNNNGVSLRSLPDASVSGSSWSGTWAMPAPIEVNLEHKHYYAGMKGGLMKVNYSLNERVNLVENLIDPEDPNALKPDDLIRRIGVCESDPDVVFFALHRIDWSNQMEPKLWRTQNAEDGELADWEDLTQFLKPSGTNLPVTNRYEVSVILVDPDNPNRMWVGFQGILSQWQYGAGAATERVLYTANAQAAPDQIVWTDISAGLPPLPVNDLVYQRGTGDLLYAATDVGVFYYDGAEESWKCFNEDLPVSFVTSLKIHNCEQKLYASTYGRGAWRTDLIRMGTKTLSEDLTIEDGELLVMKTNLVLEPGVTLTVKGELMMPDDATIRVNPNSKLLINGGRIDNACDGMWRGIVVVGNSNQPQFEPYQGKVVLTNGGSIENAILGVSLGVKNENGTLDLSTTGGILVCSTGAQFINCQRAVRAYDYTGEFANRTKFYNTTFEINDELSDGSTPSYQVQMRGVDGIRFQNCTLTNTRDDEFTIFDAGKGIAASNTGFRVEGCLFENLEYGIRVKSIGFDDIKISENTFTGNLGGVSLRYSGLAEVVQNTFNIPAISDLDIHPSNVAYGIYLGGSTGYAVEENTFYGDNIDQNAGIAIHNSGPEPNRIYNNEFGRLSAGIVAMGNNRGTNIYHGLLFECNDLGSFDYPLGFSLALTNQGEVRHYQGYLGNDGGAANVFEPVCAPTTLQEREFSLGDDTPPDSPVLYFPYAQENTRPDCHTPDMVTVPVSEQVLNKNERCPSNFFNGGSIEEIKDKYVANTSLYQGLQVVYNNEYNGGDIEFLKDLISDPTVSSFALRNELLLASPKVTSRLLIGAIQRDPAMNPWHLAQVLLANSRLTQDVINALNKSDVHPYYRELVMDGQNGGMSNTAIMESELGHFGGLMEFARTDYVRQLYRADSTNTLNDSIIHYLSSDASPQLMKTMMAYHIKRSQWQAAQDLLGEASNLRWSSDYVDLVGILMDALSDSANANAVIESKNTQLLAIAAENNTEAFLAQSILETYELADFPDYIELPTPGTKSMFKGKPDKRELIKPIASAHPNPAKDMIYVNWRLPEGMTPRAISLVIFNGQGVQLLTRSIINEVGIEEINTVNWPSGLYIYQLLHDNKPIHNGKFEVLR